MESVSITKLTIGECPRRQKITKQNQKSEQNWCFMYIEIVKSNFDDDVD